MAWLSARHLSLTSGASRRCRPGYTMEFFSKKFFSDGVSRDEGRRAPSSGGALGIYLVGCVSHGRAAGVPKHLYSAFFLGVFIFSFHLWQAELVVVRCCLYRVVHKFCSNTSTVKLSAMKANISLFKPTIGKSRQFLIRLMWQKAV